MNTYTNYPLWVENSYNWTSRLEDFSGLRPYCLSQGLPTKMPRNKLPPKLNDLQQGTFIIMLDNCVWADLGWTWQSKSALCFRFPIFWAWLQAVSWIQVCPLGPGCMGNGAQHMFFSLWSPNCTSTCRASAWVHILHLTFHRPKQVSRRTPSSMGWGSNLCLWGRGGG